MAKQVSCLGEIENGTICLDPFSCALRGTWRLVQREGVGPYDCGGCAGSSGMAESTCRAARAGDLAEVERLVGHDPGLLNAKDGHSQTPLILASFEGHTEVVRWLLDKGAATNERTKLGSTALFLACRWSHLSAASLLLERGGDATIAGGGNSTPLIEASLGGHLETVRLLLGQPSDRTTIDHRNTRGETALWLACFRGRGGVVRALLERGADPTITNNDGTTPMAVAKQDPPPDRDDISAKGHRICVVALEVRYQSLLSSTLTPGLASAPLLLC
jgi:hypothetical protein